MAAGSLAIAGGDLRAVVSPELGGGLARFDCMRAGTRLPIFRAAPDGVREPFALAANLLVPWSNRISGGGFQFAGRFHPLAPNVPGEPCPIHGNGFALPWRVAADRTDASTAALTLASDGPGPYRYDASMVYALSERALTMTLSVTNRAEFDLPYGLGFHPWLPRTPGTTLTARATTIQLEDARHLPAGIIAVDDRPAWDFAAPRELPQGWINNGFSGWDGQARVVWPERGLSLDIAADAALSTYLVFSPSSDADFFCFEPVTHPVDAHNLSGGPQANGLRVLGPGATLAVSCRFATSSV